MDIRAILGISLVLLVAAYLLKGIAGYLKHVWKVLARSLVAFFGIWAANLVGGYFGFHLGLNLVTVLVIGIFGVPGIGLLLAVKYLL